MIYMIKEMWSDGWIGRIILLVIVALVAGIALGIPLSIREEMRWNKWASAHCREIGEMSGDVFIGTGIGSNGSVVTTVGSTSSKTGYQCDDGKQYWR